MHHADAAPPSPARPGNRVRTSRLCRVPFPSFGPSRTVAGMTHASSPRGSRCRIHADAHSPRPRFPAECMRSLRSAGIWCATMSQPVAPTTPPLRPAEEPTRFSGGFARRPEDPARRRRHRARSPFFFMSPVRRRRAVGAGRGRKLRRRRCGSSDPPRREGGVPTLAYADRPSRSRGARIRRGRGQDRVGLRCSPCFT